MAPRYSQDIIDQVISANDIVDVISEYITLKKSGSSYMGKCPFHNEKTPSFSVSRDKQLYHCFGCGVGGNVMTFIMEMEKLPFLDALDMLAKRGHITLPELAGGGDDTAYKHKERLYNLHRDIANYYYLQLRHSPEALAYLYDRGLSDETIYTFGIGLSPNEWQKSFHFLCSKGYTEEEILDTGICIKSDNGRIYDRFRNRVMFPIQSTTDRIIGFGGRKIAEADKGPKYLNSPETPVFSKGYELYNLNRAKKNTTKDRLVIVEGYMDVISLFQHGVKNAVAALGTAFTKYHNGLLSRYAKEVVICFDGDAAGEKATEKAVEILKRTDLNVKIMRLPIADDPDSYIRNHSLKAFETALDNSMTVIEYELERLKKRYNLKYTDHQVAYVKQAIALLRTISSDVEIDLYTRRIAGETDIDAAVIKQQVYATQNRAMPQNEDMILKKAVSSKNKIPKAFATAQIGYLKSIINHPETIKDGLLPAEYFSKGYFRTLYQTIVDRIDAGKPCTPGVIIDDFQDKKGSAFTAKILMDDDVFDNDALKRAEAIILEYHYRSEIEMLKKEIEATPEDDVEKASALTNEIIALKRKLMM